MIMFIFIFKKTPLMIAIYEGNKDIVQLLLSHPQIDVNLFVILKKIIIFLIQLIFFIFL